MFLQVRHLLKADLGYNTENIILLNNRVFDASQSQAFKNELLNCANVEDVALCCGCPIDGGNNNTGVFNKKMLSFQVMFGDSAYFKIMGFQIVQDNQLAERGMWFNETAMKDMELPYDTPGVDFWNPNTKIAGIVKDFKYRGIREKIGPVALFYNTEFDPWSFLIKISGDPLLALKDVSTVYEKVSEGDIFTGKYIQDILNEMCENERNTSKILTLFTIMAIVISSLGLYAMALYFIRQRAGEIAVRKVFGSSSNQMTVKLLKSYLILVLIAFFIAIPIIWYFMSKWLSDYPVHITLNVWIFLAGGLSALLIAFLIVFYESLKAAHANPVESLKK
jgi:putative ABC transport system permease protein